MRIKFRVPQDGIEGRLLAYDENGKEVKVTTMEWEPYFFRPEAIPNVMFATVEADNGKVCYQAVITVSGARGTLRMMATNPVKSAIEARGGAAKPRPLAVLGAAAPAEDAEDSDEDEASGDGDQ